MTAPFRGDADQGDYRRPADNGTLGRPNVPEILVIQHAPWETIGSFAEIFERHGGRMTTVQLSEGGGLPDWRDFDAIVAMGGPMSSTDESLSWLGQEKQAIAAAAHAGTPIFGVCLGAQLLASALGARVYRGPCTEIGVGAVSLTPESFTDPLFGGLPRKIPVFQWHGEGFDLPEGAVPLARSDMYPCQALRFGRSAYGIQFHLEVSVEMLTEWSEVQQCQADVEQALGPSKFPGLIDQLAAHERGQFRLAQRIFSRWLEIVHTFRISRTG